ncbi:MAG: outer membrane protein transport protein [Hyphomicrobium sp.]
MRKQYKIFDGVGLAGISTAALLACTSAASAGGFAISEQSTVFMGMTSAGAAAGGPISSMYWNPAATASLPGLNTESSYTLVVPQGDVNVKTINGAPADGIPGGTGSGNIGIGAYTGASFGTYQLSKDLWVGLSVSSPFGLATKPENNEYIGSLLGVTSKLLTVNASPTLAYKIAPGVTIGAGIQVEYAWAKLQFAEGVGGSPIAQFKGDDWAVGGTVGILLEPFHGTSIGVGYRSGLNHDLDGRLKQPVVPPGRFDAVGSIDLPDLVTASFRQVITPTTRLLGTVEWTNWSRFDQITLKSDGVGGTLAVPTNWSDGWFFSLGAEYDYTPYLTLRTGIAYELSPEDDPSKRLTIAPDNNRVWLSAGASYKWSDTLTIDVAYSHIFVEDGGFERAAVVDPSLVLAGEINNASADLISVGLRTQW